jgi:hypothetical protein
MEYSHTDRSRVYANIYIQSNVPGAKSDEPSDMVKARNAILAAIPLPKEVPDDTLSPLSIPATFTLQEFLSSMSGVTFTLPIYFFRLIDDAHIAT